MDFGANRHPFSQFASFAQFVAAMSPNAMIASILFSSFFSFVIIFNVRRRFSLALRMDRSHRGNDRVSCNLYRSSRSSGDLGCTALRHSLVRASPSKILEKVS
jgi:hypothetical protein